MNMCPASTNSSISNTISPTTVSMNGKDFMSAIQHDVFEFLCTFHRVRRPTTSKGGSGGCSTSATAMDANSPSTSQKTPSTLDFASLSDEQRDEKLGRLLHRIIQGVDQRVHLFHLASEKLPGTDYYDEWTFLTWTLMSVINRLQHLPFWSQFVQQCHASLVKLVNKAHRIQPPSSVLPGDPRHERFYQAYVTAVVSFHELYTMTKQKWVWAEFEERVDLFREQLRVCLAVQREFANHHGQALWRRVRESQIQRMTVYAYDNRRFLEPVMEHYTHSLYALGVLAARMQGFAYDSRTNKAFQRRPDLVTPLLQLVYSAAEMLIADALVCIEPSQTPILVTNNLFPMKVVSLCRIGHFRQFSLQIVSEEVAQQLQQELRQRQMVVETNAELPAPPLRIMPSGALLAIKPSSGVKRNNARASDEGGNTAHKKSDVNSKEWLALPPTFDPDLETWVSVYPHLLCTTRQKDPFLDARCAYQMGKRPLFYFHVRAEMFSPAGTAEFASVHTLSLPFTIATRRNQDCQVQRMLSSYTATCFWLYGTQQLEGLLVRWYDGEIEWQHFRRLYAQYFSMNAEVCRSLTEDDFRIIRAKMNCPECTDEQHLGQFQKPVQKVTFKNVLCPHLHYVNGKVDSRFSIWRGMLELLHLFSDQKTQSKSLWEAGVLQGFLKSDEIHAQMSLITRPCLSIYLSFVIGALRTEDGQVLDLEPLDIKRLQAKSLFDYLKDIVFGEKVEYVWGINGEWWTVDEAFLRCHKSMDGVDSPMQQKTPSGHQTKELRSNAMHAGPVEIEQQHQFTALQVAVVTCKVLSEQQERSCTILSAFNASPSATAHDPLNNTSGSHHECYNASDDSFDKKLEELMNTFGRDANGVLEALKRLQLNHVTLKQNVKACSNANNVYGVVVTTDDVGNCENISASVVAPIQLHSISSAGIQSLGSYNTFTVQKVSPTITIEQSQQHDQKNAYYHHYPLVSSMPSTSQPAFCALTFANAVADTLQKKDEYSMNYQWTNQTESPISGCFIHSSGSMMGDTNTALTSHSVDMQSRKMQGGANGQTMNSSCAQPIHQQAYAQINGHQVQNSSVGALQTSGMRSETYHQSIVMQQQQQPR